MYSQNTPGTASGQLNPTTVLAPACPSCNRFCKPGATWKGANYCRGLILLGFIKDQPGLTGWKLSQASGMPYPDTTRGLAKLKEYGVVSTESEDRIEGGFRYRYWPSGDDDAHERYMETLRRVEALQ